MKKYFGEWSNYEEVAASFEEPIAPPDEIVLASYEYGSYDGTAFVLFVRDGKPYEVNGSHCSCYGLEGQWTPEETTWPALAMRKFGDYSGVADPEALVLLRDVIAAHTEQVAS